MCSKLDCIYTASMSSDDEPCDDEPDNHDHDKTVHIPVCEDSPHLPICEDSPHDVCQLCGANDRDLIEWDDGIYVCVCCHACQICGGEGPELIDWGDGLYMCIYCREQTRLEQQNAEIPIMQTMMMEMQMMMQMLLNVQGQGQLA